MDKEVVSRRAKLLELLDGEVYWESIRARSDYWIAVILYVVCVDR